MPYNLLDEAWIPVLYRTGAWKRVGLLEALRHAGEIREIAASNPMDRVAILRFLLAILYWCRGNPDPNQTAALNEGLPATWLERLEQNRDCFELLGDGKRFYQCPQPGAEKLSANYLIHEIPTGTNANHFRHALEDVDGLCPACCATGLLRLPAFATSGGRGKPPGINSKPPFYAIPVGPSLAQTLALSWRPVEDLGTPAWEVPDVPLPLDRPIPLLTGLTWLPRRVWLEDPDVQPAPCIACGRVDHLIHRAVFAGIGSTKGKDDAPARQWSDPHTICVDEEKGAVCARSALGAEDAAADLWFDVLRDLLQASTDTANRLWVVGFATVQNDKYIEAVEWSIPLDLGALGAGASELAARVNQWSTSGRSMHKRITRPMNKPLATGIPEGSAKAAGASIRPHIEHDVLNGVPALQSGDEAAWEAVVRQYAPMMLALARANAPGYSVEALKRRDHLASIRPNARPKATKSKKKGESQ